MFGTIAVMPWLFGFITGSVLTVALTCLWFFLEGRVSSQNELQEGLNRYRTTSERSARY